MIMMNISKEPLTKRLKLNYVISKINVTPFSSIKVNLDILVDKSSSKITNMDVCDSLGV